MTIEETLRDLPTIYDQFVYLGVEKIIPIGDVKAVKSETVENKFIYRVLVSPDDYHWYFYKVEKS